MATALNTPIWHSTPHGPTRPPLQDERTAEVTVVAAGIAGLTIASLLARAGLEVVVLEARTIGDGTTGHTTAKVSALQGVRYQTLAQHRGDSVVVYAPGSDRRPGLDR